MSKSDCKAVRIANASAKKVLSKGQKRFNSLIKRLETKRKLLQRWQETIPVYRQRVLTEYDFYMMNTMSCGLSWCVCLMPLTLKKCSLKQISANSSI